MNMPTSREMAEAYVVQMEQKLKELEGQVETLTTHVKECKYELYFKIDFVWGKSYIEKINEYERSVGVEIGVRDAFSSNEVINRTTIKKLYGIDINDSENGRKLQEETQGRYTFIQGKSPEMSKDFDDNSLDFVFVDGDHSYEGCKADIEAWWPKLKKGGIMSGDDYGHTFNPTEGKYGVVEAVEEFVKENNLKCTVFYNDYKTEIKEQRDFVAEKVGYLIELCHARKKREYEIPELNITYNTAILPPLWLLEK